MYTRDVERQEETKIIEGKIKERSAKKKEMKRLKKEKSRLLFLLLAEGSAHTMMKNINTII